MSSTLLLLALQGAAPGAHVVLSFATERDVSVTAACIIAKTRGVGAVKIGADGALGAQAGAAGKRTHEIWTAAGSARHRRASFCGPGAFALPRRGDRFLWCTGATPRQWDDTSSDRVALLELETSGAHAAPTIEHLSMSAGGLTFELSSIPGAFVPTMSVLGGDFERDTTGTIVAAGPAELRLEPSCVASLVQLPPELGALSQVEPDVTFGGQTKRLARSASGSVRVELPFGKDDVPRELRFVFAGSATVAVSWSARRPPPVMHAAVRAFSFKWERPCLYGRARACPTPRAVGAKVACTWVEKYAAPCEYRCAGDDVSFPFLVELVPSRRVGGQCAPEAMAPWQETISRVDETVRGMTAPEQRVFAIEHEQIRSPVENPGYRVEEILIFGLREQLRRRVSSDGCVAPVSLPIECTARIDYELVGAWPHRRGQLEVHDGRLRPQSFEETVFGGRFGLRFGAALAWHTIGDNFGARDLATLAKVEPRAAVYLAWRPAPTWVSWLEPALTYAVGFAAYHPIGGDGQPAAEPEHVVVNRVGGRLAILEPIVANDDAVFIAGLSLGGGASLPIDGDGRARAGSVQAYAELTVPVVIRPRGLVAFEVGPFARAEPVRIFHSSDLNGNPPYEQRVQLVVGITGDVRLEW